MYQVKYLGIDVQVYQFKQPRRLHAKELPFKIVLSRTLDMGGLKVLPVDYATAADSWCVLFPPVPRIA